MRKAVSILMAISLIVLNIRFYFPGYDLIEERKKSLTAPPTLFCILKTSISDNLILLSNVNFSFIFLYSYLVLEHTLFLINHGKKICFGYLGTWWVIMTILTVLLCIYGRMYITILGDCDPSNLIFYYLYIPFSILPLFLDIYSVIQVYRNMKKSEDNEITKKFKKRLFLLGIIQSSMVLLYPLFFVLPDSAVMYCLKFSVLIISFFCFFFYYTLEEETIKTLKEIFCCKPAEVEKPRDDSLYEELRNSD